MRHGQHGRPVQHLGERRRELEIGDRIRGGEVDRAVDVGRQQMPRSPRRRRRSRSNSATGGRLPKRPPSPSLKRGAASSRRRPAVDSTMPVRTWTVRTRRPGRRGGRLPLLAQRRRGSRFPARTARRVVRRHGRRNSQRPTPTGTQWLVVERSHRLASSSVVVDAARAARACCRRSSACHRCSALTG